MWIHFSTLNKALVSLVNRLIAIAPPVHNDDALTVFLDYTAKACPGRPKLLNASPEILLDSPFLDRSINTRGDHVHLPKWLDQVVTGT